LSRIALVLPDLAGGGAERVMLTLCREFVARGYQVDLVVIRATGALRELVPKGVRLIELGARNIGTSHVGLAISTVVRLSRWLVRETPTTILSTVTGMNLAVILARKITRSPVRLVIREATTLENFRSRLRILAMRWLYPQADFVVAVSPTVEKQLVTNLGVPNSRVRHIPNAVDKQFVRQQATLSNEHPWLTDPRIKVAIAVGRLSRAKDYPTLLRGFSAVPRSTNARLLIVGEGPERPTLEGLIGSLGIEDRVQLVGFDINPWRWMSRADLYVLSSRWEGNPNALLEALVLQCPTVVTAYDHTVEEMASFYRISVVPVGDGEAMGKAIAQQLIKPTVPLEQLQAISLEEVAIKYLEVLECATGRT
jgi:glycosyltransferase involved in cell wall biosynthesis